MEKSNGRVLIVEDDMLLSLVEEKLLKKLGYSIVGKAVSGEEAIRKVEKFNPDIVMMDISLKGTDDGIDTMKKIRRFSSVPVIYLSGSTDKHSIERAKKTNFVDFLIKPVSEQELKGPLVKAMNINKEADRKLSYAS